jgi:hypothetical protein
MAARASGLRRFSALTSALAIGLCAAVACSDAARSTHSSTSVVRLRAVELAAEDPMPGGTYVIVENRGASRVGLGCWRIRTGKTTRTIKSPVLVPARAGLRLFFDRGDVRNPDRIALLNRAGRVVDTTPLLHDTKGDDRLFARVDGRWTLGRAPLPARVIEGGFLKPGSTC